MGKTIFPQKTPKEFLDEACAVPKDADIRLAVKSLKLLGAMSITKQGNIEKLSF